MFLVSIFAVPSATETAIANGDTRTLHLVHANTHETIDATFRVNGAYDPAVLKQLNWFLRDWRRDEATTMDPRLFDVVWEVYRSAGATDPITVYSGYRSPSTNAMLRRRSRAVAEHSQHMLGKAMDTTMPGMPMEKIREIGMRLQRGGVGYYQNANFVHLDVGGVRSWPRMSYDQLARLFPDGKTVHIAADGRTLARYEEARAEIEAGGGTAEAPPAQQSKGFFAWLFGGSKEDDEEAEAVQAATPAQGRRGAARPQVASARPQPRGQVQLAAAAPAAGTDEDGGRNFFINEQRARPGAPAPVVAVAPPPPPAPAPVPAPAPAAPPPQQQLAAIDTLPPPPTAADDAPAAAPIPTVLPPRRPADLATLASADIPLPPIRPTLVATADLPPLPAAPRAMTAAADPIGTLISTSTVPKSRPRLPPEITQGFSGRRSATDAPSDVLAYAPAAQMQGLRTAAAQGPVPTSGSGPGTAAGADVVSARLDRSNFASLTSAVALRDSIAQSGLAPTVASLRQSARMVARLFSNELTASGYASQFGAAATSLVDTRFSGSAVQPLPGQAGLVFAETGLRKD